MDEPFIIIKRRLLLLLCVLLGFVGTIFLLIAWSLLSDLHLWQMRSYIDMQQRQNGRLEKIQQLEQENAELILAMRKLGDLMQLDKVAALELSGSLQDLQNERHRLREELEFYQGIIAPEQQAAGFRIHDLVVSPIAQRRYQLRLVMTNIDNSHRSTEGKLEIMVGGLQDGSAKQLPLSALSTQSSFPNKFKFTNFKQLISDIIIPSGFEPHHITVIINLKNKKQNRIEQTFQWTSIVI